ncbi:FAD-dependent oxidoreductase [Rhizobium mesosinicum]|uniref:FAD-dependent oxidoreductase n=1 Tax=Rhizobium mesosinicum TaxID=335017 RepID=A0ABS7GMU8_9HYPH|nr:FAD-dependent oxidoreductase [Rhizobium mesosinicum]MBW9051107.1 FAD-dependent oxidoreductase [Rhizobium mesosinicum]
MTDIETFDMIVFGGGKAGKTLAMEKARAGRRVAVVEEGMIGGSCINVACIPSKTLIRSAEVAYEARTTSAFGTIIENVRTDLPAVRDRTAKVVAEMVATNQAGFDASGLHLVLGFGKFIAPKTIEVVASGSIRRLSAPQIFINLGTVATIPEIPGLKEAQPLTHKEALRLGDLPTRLLVLGGGYIGMEMSQAFRRLGADVTIIERGSRLAPREDLDASKGITDVLQNEGICVALDCKDLTVQGTSGQRVVVKTGDGGEFEGSHLLVAAGRTPRTAGIGLDLAGIDVDERGFIKVDDQLRTSAEGVWAMGEVAGSPMFTHASLDDYRVVKSSLEEGFRSTDGRLVPYVVFIDPEFARVGINEEDAKREGLEYRVAKLAMDVIPRARTMSKRQGFMKAIVSADTDEIFGFSMLGVNAGEVMSVVQMAMLGGLPYPVLRDAILAHPTISEGLGMLFANVSASS